MERKKCLECGAPVLGRSDKKFCGDHCRNSHNNRLNREVRNLIRNTNNGLKRNYRTLSGLNSKGKTRVPRAWLARENFDFGLFTSIYTTKAGKVYYFVYDQGYLELGNDLFLLIRKAPAC